MNRYSENYKNTGSKSVAEIERNAHIINTFSVAAVGSDKGFRHQYAFIVSKSRGAGVRLTVRKQCSNGNEIARSLIVAKQNLDTLRQSMHDLSKPVQAAKKRVDELSYINSLLDSCFKGWH
ncbi:hypothetical protein HMPREF1210_01170 [Paenisporosarcina sp. HGH0030]|uniref:hypothetical protein n=1 Tax=Paenisporosarcina sp. HGH0030 TaxID=1078085 RepID=UPI00034E42C9|nr:hypothetical protein [Paenisporosarcina sp. HGH0030]EPD52790.1 hypothetical protein HMPREF1210_01170 [Paenisporosarcina sp. HGH0030]